MESFMIALTKIAREAVAGSAELTTAANRERAPTPPGYTLSSIEPANPRTCAPANPCRSRIARLLEDQPRGFLRGLLCLPADVCGAAAAADLHARIPHQRAGQLARPVGHHRLPGRLDARHRRRRR